MIRITVSSKSRKDLMEITSCLSQQNDFFIVSSGTDGFHALKSAKINKPDIIIIDYNLNDINGPDLAPIIKRNSPSTAIIVLCSEDECKNIGRVLEAGISGCLLKQNCLDNIASSVRSVFYGGLYLSEPFRRNAMNCFSEKIFQHNYSRTERCIFNNIISGFTDNEIAKNLNMTRGSLRNSVYHVKRKTGLKNRTQISFHAAFSGMISHTEIREQFEK